MKLRILFVDDEPNVLNGLRLVLRSMRKEWDMSFANSGQEALELMATKSQDVVVSDMRMPGMDGGELLAEVQKRHPETLRIILSGYSNYEMIMKTVKPAHQFLSKPCNHEELQAVIERTMGLRSVLANEHIRTLLSQTESLPSLPEVYKALEEELNKENPSLQVIGELVEQDMGMTTSLLKLVNSSFFGLRRHVASAQQAVVLLGTETVKGLVLMVELFKDFSVDTTLQVNTGLLWQHSTNTGHLARAIAVSERKERSFCDDCFIGGLLHDVGKLVLITRMPKEYAKVLTLVREEGETLFAAEKKIFGTSHAEMGAYLLALWGLSEDVVLAVAGHHTTTFSDESAFSVGDAVFAGNIFEHKLVVVHPQYTAREFPEAFIHRIGGEEKRTQWEQICKELLDKKEM